MKQLQKETKFSPSSNECAALLMEVVPPLMGHIRKEMRSHRMPGISVPQLRTLIFLYRNEGTYLSSVAEHVGLGLPSMSKIVDTLVERKLVIRKSHSGDRRRISLKLSAQGIEVLKQTRSKAEADLTEALKSLTPSQQAGIVEALKTLSAIFVTDKSPSI
jgi:DNA-binding MarR family transcriptional regulator